MIRHFHVEGADLTQNVGAGDSFAETLVKLEPRVLELNKCKLALGDMMRGIDLHRCSFEMLALRDCGVTSAGLEHIENVIKSRVSSFAVLDVGANAAMEIADIVKLLHTAEQASQHMWRVVVHGSGNAEVEAAAEQAMLRTHNALVVDVVE
jgi:hypothetical protein